VDGSNIYIHDHPEGNCLQKQCEFTPPQASRPWPRPLYLWQSQHAPRNHRSPAQPPLALAPTAPAAADGLVMAGMGSNATIITVNALGGGVDHLVGSWAVSTAALLEAYRWQEAQSTVSKPTCYVVERGGRDRVGRQALVDQRQGGLLRGVALAQQRSDEGHGLEGGSEEGCAGSLSWMGGYTNDHIYRGQSSYI
jgi:hypothetical protein